MKQLLGCVLLGCVALCSRMFPQERPAEPHSCRQSLFVSLDYGDRPAVLSPDKSKHLLLWSDPRNPDDGRDSTKFYISIYSGRRLLRTVQLRDLSAGTYLKWSPDSRSFYVMWSSGGSVGNYHVRVFTVDAGSVRESFGPRVVAAEFRRKHYCEERGNNLFGVRWMDNGSRLLMEAGVYPTSDCEEMGFRSGYLVDVATGRIVERFSEEQVLKMPDVCIFTYGPVAQ